MPSIHSIVSTLWVVRSQSTAGTRKSGSSRVFSAISDSAAASSRRSISIATERDMRVDDLDQPQPPRFGRMRLGVVRDEEEIGEVAAETRSDIGPEHLDGDRLAHAVALGLATMHLCDGSRGHRRAEAYECLRHRAVQRRGDDGLGLGLRKRRQPVLQAFEVARHRDADDVGPGREKLSELQIGRA